MITLSSTILLIDGNENRVFDTINLEQEIDKHHTITAVFRMDAIEKDTSKEFGNESKELLGKSIAVQIKTTHGENTLNKLEFNGIITKVTIKRGSNDGLGDQVFIIGKSPTIFSDDGPHLDSFEKMTLKDIVKNTLNFYNINNEVVPLHTDDIEYSVQHNESGFEYVSRLSKQYGEWFYYNGDKVIFGKPESNPVVLTYGFDLHEFEISLIPLPNRFTYLSNDYIHDELLDISGADSPNNNQFRSSVSASAEDLFPHITQVFANQNSSERANGQLKSFADAQQASTEVNQIQLNGTSSNPGVNLGDIVEVEGDYYRITKVQHSTNRNNLYKNIFQAVPDNPKGYPLTAINAFPKSASQVAIVKENNDPQGLGRIRVQFPWQTKQNKMTPWIRVVALQAGRNGGMFRIPHKEDEVIIDFENGNVELPYTSGSLYNAKSKPPAESLSKSNHFSVWKVGGISIFLDESKGSITFTDGGKSTVVMEGDGSISVNAKAKLNLKAEDSINLESAVINIGNSSKIDETNIFGKSVKINALDLLALESDVQLQAKGAQTTVEGTATTDITSTGKMTIQGGITEIKGAMVKVN